MTPPRHVLTILAIQDLERSKRFYADAFGWDLSTAVPVYAEFDLPGGMRLGLYERHGFGINTGQVPKRMGPGEIAGTELYLHTDDIAQAVDRIRAAGGRELSPLAARDWGDEAAYFADPDGNVIAVARPLPK